MDKRETVYDEIPIVDEHELSCTKNFVVDGGYLQHAVAWNKNTCKIYHDICILYLSYLKNNFVLEKTYITVVFDGYDYLDSTKNSKQLRRYRYYITPLFKILVRILVYGNQERLFGKCSK